MTDAEKLEKILKLIEEFHEFLCVGQPINVYSVFDFKKRGYRSVEQVQTELNNIVRDNLLYVLQRVNKINDKEKINE